MTTLTATEARRRLCAFLDALAESHEPIQITSKRHTAVLISEADGARSRNALSQFDLGMRASIRRGLKTPVEKMPSKAWLVTWRIVYTSQARFDAFQNE